MEQEHQTEYLLRTVASELRDVTRLFALPAELWEEEHQPHFYWHAWEADGAYHCDFALGERQRHRDAPVPTAADERTTLLEENALRSLQGCDRRHATVGESDRHSPHPTGL